MAQEVSYRSKHDIRLEILSFISTGPKIKTHIMYKAKLSYPMLQTYLANLTEQGLIKETETGFVITAQGKEKMALLREALA